MSTVSAAIEDLERLAQHSEMIDSNIRSTVGPLDVALHALWRSSAARLGAPSDLVEDLRAHLRVSAEVADGAVSGARRLLDAGSNGTLDGALRLGPGGPLGRLLAGGAALGADELWRAGIGLAARLRAAAGTGPAAYVIRTERQRHSIELMGVGVGYELVRDELSNGAVHLTVIERTKLASGAGLGGACEVAVDGRHVLDQGVGASASLTLAGARGRTWEFVTAEQADRWWREHRPAIEAEAAARLLPGGAVMAEVAGRLGARPPEPDAAYDEVAVTGNAAAEAGLRILGTGAGVAAAASLAATTRRNRDGSLTVTVSGEGRAVTDAALSGPVGGSVGARAGAASSVAVTTSAAGALTGVVLRTVQFDQAGRRPTLDGTGTGGALHAGRDEPHLYETIIELDLTDPATRSAVETSMGLDLDRPADQILAGLHTIALDDRTLEAGRISVEERTRPADQSWVADCSVDLPVIEASVALGTGLSTVRTVARWEKAPGETELIIRSPPTADEPAR